MPWTIVLDALVAVLLIATIATSVVLNRRIASLRNDRAELEKLTQGLQMATDRADVGVSGLKVSAQTLQARLESARALADDLQFLIERGGKIADRLENDVRAAKRVEPRPSTQSTPTLAAVAGVGVASARAPQSAATAAEPRSAAERHLLAALRARA